MKSVRMTFPARGVTRILAALAMLLLGAATISGCMHGTSPATGTQIAPGLTFAVPPPAGLGRDVEAVQQVVARYRDQTYVFQAHISVSREAIRFVALDSFGRRAMSIAAGEYGISADEAQDVPRALDPRNILADIAMIYWPAGAVRRGLDGTRAVLQDAPLLRTISRDNEEIVRIAYEASREDAWNTRVSYRNMALGYELDIASRATTP